MTKRRLLGYFLESKLWKKYEIDVVDDYAHWAVEDQDRATRMWRARYRNAKGYKVEEYLCDMLQCVMESGLKDKTKHRLYK
jgi:hypothetical protein